MVKFIFSILFFCSASFAANVVAVLEIIPQGELEEEVSIAEMRRLTDEVRTQALETLPKQDYVILTRDGMFALLPPDEEEAECLAEGCAVDIGRAIGADFISQGTISKFGGDLSVSLQLYESMGGKLLGSVSLESPDVKGLLTQIKEKTPGLFAKILPEPTVQVQQPDSVKITEAIQAIPANISEQTSNKIKTSTWVAIGLDVLGAAALGFGFYQNSKGDDAYSKYKDNNLYYGERQAAKQDADDAKSLRNISYITGGVLLASGIGVHIWF